MISITIFGDSITAGYSREAGMPRIAPILKERLEARLTELQVRSEVLLCGVCGEDTDEALLRLKVVIDLQSDWTILFFGANDAATDHTVSPERFYKNLQVMVENFGVDKVVIVSPPYHNDRVENQLRNNELVHQFCESAKRVASDFEVPFLNLYQEMCETKEPEQLLQSDGLHFSRQGYELLAEKLSLLLANL
ncbi:MAG: GDSL-type esterase/lipase family protein [Streptococcaceae bacterium]|nr:GDSL-type esterase/lipase family protein [Streptococcaceae bacterium]